jgi:GT2 family glycosyltransferase
MTRPRVRLVVLTYNGRDNVGRCFEHLHALDWPADRLELVLVDNASRDDSAEVVAQQFPDVRVVRMDHNRGFPANNEAMADHEAFDYVGLVNDDAFVASDYLAPLVDTMEHDAQIGAVSPKMLFASTFVDIEVRTDVTAAGRGDPRSLGVRISGLTVGGRDAWRRAHVIGGHGRETARGGAYEWTTASTTIRVPLQSRSGDAPRSVELLLSAPAPRQVTLQSAAGSVTVPVGREAVWCEAPIGDSAHGDSAHAYDVVNNAGSIVTTDGHGADRGFGEPDGPAFAEPCDVFAWCGGAVLLRSDYLDDVGLFDERFFLYYEDTDLSWRGRARGWRHRYVPDAEVRHVHAATTVEGSSNFAFYTERNRLLMVLKNAPRPMVRRVVGDYLGKTYDAARRDIAGAMAQGRRPNAVPVQRRLRALAGFARWAPAVAAERPVVRGRQLVDDDVLLSGLTPV